MKNLLLYSMIAIFSFLLLVIMAELTPPRKDVDELTKKACQEYANNSPWSSIPLERQKWLDEEGFDYINYDYYQDCINQKLPQELTRPTYFPKK